MIFIITFLSLFIPYVSGVTSDAVYQYLYIGIVLYLSLTMYRKRIYSMTALLLFIYALRDLIDISLWLVGFEHFLAYDLVMAPLALYMCIGSIVPKVSDDYCGADQFIVYREPRTFCQHMAALFCFGYGTCFAVCNGMEYKFKGGRVIKRAHTTNPRYIYKYTILGDCEKVVGKRWSLWNNCFRVFNNLTKD